MQTVLESSQRLGCLLSHRKLYPRLQKETVRHLRKPKWVPMAKSKMYTIRDIPPQPYHEAEEYKRLLSHNQLFNKSLWTFQKRISAEQEARNQAHAIDLSEEGELERIFSETERDNAIVKAIREKHLADEWQRVKDEIIEKRDKCVEDEIQTLQITEQNLEAEMERLKLVIKEEDLDAVIEKVLAVEVDYNFGVDNDGKVYKGRHNHDKGETVSLKGPLTSLALQTTRSTSSTKAQS